MTPWIVEKITYTGEETLFFKNYIIPAGPKQPTNGYCSQQD
jgi:hypothetical protein